MKQQHILDYLVYVVVFILKLVVYKLTCSITYSLHLFYIYVKIKS